MKTTTCAICHSVFEHPDSEKRVYCSKPCQYKATSERKTQPDSRVTTMCPSCGKEFTYYRSWPRKFCSKVCSGKATIANIPSFVPSRTSAVCEACGTTFEYTPGGNRGRFCSKQCWGRWLSDATPRGADHPRYKQKFGRSLREPNPAILTCPICERQFEAKPSHVGRRRFCSRACAGKWMSVNNAGANSPVWRGGRVPYYGPSWRPAMRLVRTRDKVCQDCGAPPKPKKALDVHHLVAFRTFGVERHAEANDPANLVALCNVCHLNREWATNRREA